MIAILALYKSANISLNSKLAHLYGSVKSCPAERENLAITPVLQAYRQFILGHLAEKSAKSDLSA